MSRCPAPMTALVATRSTVKRYTAPETSGIGVSVWRARTAPSQRLSAGPSPGCSSINVAVKSVSGASVAAHRSTTTGPVISIGATRGSER